MIVEVAVVDTVVIVEVTAVDTDVIVEVAAVDTVVIVEAAAADTVDDRHAVAILFAPVKKLFMGGCGMRC